MTITVGKLVTDYLLQPLASDFGTAYCLIREGDAEQYDVHLDADGGRCECKGFLRWSRCKHRDGLLALRKAGHI